MTEVHKRLSEIVTYVTEDKKQEIYVKEEPDSLRTVQLFTTMSAETFKDYFGSGLFTLKHHSYDHSVEKYKGIESYLL